MAVAIKLLLLNSNDSFSNGLTSIRKREKEMIDISAYEAGISDATATTVPGYVIKDNVVYRIIRSYFDLDKNARIFIASKSSDSYDVWPEP